MQDCDGCDGAEPTAFIIGNAETGDQQFLGYGCFARMGLEFAKVILPAEEIAERLGPMFVRGAEKPAEAAKRVKGGKVPEKPSEAPPSTSGPAEGTSEESTAVANE